MRGHGNEDQFGREVKERYFARLYETENDAKLEMIRVGLQSYDTVHYRLHRTAHSSSKSQSSLGCYRFIVVKGEPRRATVLEV